MNVSTQTVTPRRDYPSRDVVTFSVLTNKFKGVVFYSRDRYKVLLVHAKQAVIGLLAIIMSSIVTKFSGQEISCDYRTCHRSLNNPNNVNMTKDFFNNNAGFIGCMEHALFNILH